MSHPIYCSSSSSYIHSCDCFSANRPHDYVGGPSLEALINQEIQLQAQRLADAATKSTSTKSKPPGGHSAKQAGAGGGGTTDEDEEEIATVQPEVAAVAIQSAFRGSKARADVKKKKEEEVEAATTVQTAFRGMTARKEVSEKKETKKQQQALFKAPQQFRPYKLQNDFRVVLEIRQGPKYWTQFDTVEEFSKLLLEDFPSKIVQEVRYSTTTDCDRFSFVIKDQLIQDYKEQLQLTQHNGVHAAAIALKKDDALSLTEKCNHMRAQLDQLIQEKEGKDDDDELEADDDDESAGKETPQTLLSKELERFEELLKAKSKDIRSCEKNQRNMEHHLKILDERVKRFGDLHSVSVEFKH